MGEVGLDHNEEEEVDSPEAGPEQKEPGKRKDTVLEGEPETRS